MSVTNVRDDELPHRAGDAADVAPVPAASTIVLRGDADFEILLLERHGGSSFVPGSWVFPGGVVDESDRALATSALGSSDELDVARACALRELFEETALFPAARRIAMFEDATPHLREAASALVWTARWITPVGVPKRFDTWFFLVSVAADAGMRIQESEITRAEWMTPDEALERHRAGTLPMVFPTIRNLEALTGFRSVDELLAVRRGATIRTTRPRLVIEGGIKRIELPDEAE